MNSICIAAAHDARVQLSYRQILHIWWPLATSWLLMTAELPLISAVIARLPAPEINLAAWGVVFSMAIIIQSPSTMLLAASTALSKDWDSYRKLWRFMIVIGAVLTGLHALIAFTPLYYVLMEGLIGLPPQIVEPVRVGLMIMTPWSLATAYRRFQQGVLIRFDHSRAVVWGSLIRVGVDIIILTAGFLIGGIPGVVVGTSGIITAVVCEAIYSGFRVRPVVRDELRLVPRIRPALTLRAFLSFYLPLALTVLLMLLVTPFVNAALSRMPNALESLAVWPVVFGFLLVWQSMGLAYNEAVIALLDRPRAVRSLRRFTGLLTVTITILLLVVAITPLTGIWFGRLAGLTPALVDLARPGMWLGLLLPGLKVLQSWYQGAITYGRQTRGITEAFAVSLLISGIILWWGVNWGGVTGLYVGLGAVLAGYLIQTAWLWQRARPILQALQLRDTTYASPQTKLPIYDKEDFYP
jgi:hypothetical protein